MPTKEESDLELNMAPSENFSPNFLLPSLDQPPLYRIDLNLPPRLRYNDICRDFKDDIIKLAPVYYDILNETPYPRVFGHLTKLLLRRVHSKEETQEICGIAQATGMGLDMVVAYNTFLELFSGCVSGGARVNDAGDIGETEGIVHFRNLDWEMPPLRKLIICVEYVRDERVIARGITYAGYIGVLTGVRKGLSMSLNFRLRLDSPFSVSAHRRHQILLLLGFRPSIASQLRDLLLADGSVPTLAEIGERLANSTSSPCYLTFCSPDSILILEKDLRSASLQTSDEFLAVTNHDTQHEVVESLPRDVADFLTDSMTRKSCIHRLWEGLGLGGRRVVEVKKSLETRPLLNETTHFSCIMDPSSEGGGLVWVQAYREY